ncbi:DNA repair protein XRCC4-like [Anoplophora glabripennis]|uniref:DNA repair protein XRCC4-like n=1 Tax=Anoplophora glabripennis TaxID=217634 RepID=UPI0008735FBE|nr:DNA repair protein XRCC4-like [Anoplophora glabripennis]
MDKSVFKLIRDDETNDSFRLSVEFKEYDFNLTIFKKTNAWTARVERENIRIQAKRLEIESDEYLKNIQEYLRNTPTSVTLKFNDNDFIINCILENNMKVIYFSYKLEKVNYSDSIEILLEKFYTERNNSLERLITLHKEKNELEKCKNQFQTKLNEFIERKKTDDEELLSNFVLVLNEKKKRIQHLTESLEALRRGRPSVNPSVEVKKRSKRPEQRQQIKVEKKEIASESDSEEAYNTDDEKSKGPQNSSDKNFNHEINQNRNDVYAIPSTSKFDLFSDDSPPRHLPKRIKSEASVDNGSYIKPSTSTEGSTNKKQHEKFDGKSVEDTPNVNFSTQELLDNM